MTITVRCQRDADPHQAKIRGRDHKVSGERGQQPGPFPPQAERARDGEHDPREARREERRPEIFAFGARIKRRDPEGPDRLHEVKASSEAGLRDPADEHRLSGHLGIYPRALGRERHSRERETEDQDGGFLDEHLSDCGPGRAPRAKPP